MPDNTDPWKLENHHRRSIDRGISKLNLNNEDIVIISDLDEIIDTDVLVNIQNKTYVLENNRLYALEQDLYYYNLNTRYIHKWYHSKILNFHTYMNKFRRDTETIRMYCQYSKITKGGWHLTYFGDVNFIKNKLRHFSHQEFNNDK